MNDPVDLFPGFSAQHVETEAGRFFVRVGGHGAPLLLLHGYPQTHAEWHRIAPRLADRFTVVAMDLRGYGDSVVPESRDGAGMTKRVMGADAVAVMAKLGHGKFRLVGHDRGGRVAYRLAFDKPDILEKVAVIDIIPTASMFRDMGKARSAISKYHWSFLAQPEPFPETMIGASSLYYLEHTLASWTATKDLSAFDPRALQVRTGDLREARTPRLGDQDAHRSGIDLVCAVLWMIQNTSSRSRISDALTMSIVPVTPCNTL